MSRPRPRTSTATAWSRRTRRSSRCATRRPRPLANLAKLRSHFDAYGPGGFYDAVDVTSGQVSQRYLSLDQGMVMAALGNALAGDDMRGYVAPGGLEQVVKPLMHQEVFTTAPNK